MRKKKQPTPKPPPPEEPKPKTRFVTTDKLDMKYAGPARRAFLSIEDDEKSEYNKTEGFSELYQLHQDGLHPGSYKHQVASFNTFVEGIMNRSPVGWGFSAFDVDSDIGSEIANDKKLLSILLLGYFFGMKHGIEDLRMALAHLMGPQ